MPGQNWVQFAVPNVRRTNSLIRGVPGSSGIDKLAHIEQPSTLVLLNLGKKFLSRMWPFSKGLRKHLPGKAKVERCHGRERTRIRPQISQICAEFEKFGF